MNNNLLEKLFSRMLVVEQEYNRHSSIEATMINQKLGSKNNFLSEHLNALKNDINKIFSSIAEQAHGIGEIPTNYNTNFSLEDNFVFNAFTFLDEINKEVEIIFSYGLFASIDDFFFRLMCNEEFFSEHSNHVNLWGGRLGGFFRPIGAYDPHTRFFDYRQAGTMRGVRNINGEIFVGSYASGFFSAVPIGDKERMFSAKQMIYYSILWIYLHEKGHFWEGHLHFLNMVKKDNKISVNEIKGIADSNNIINKILECQADRYATNVLMEILFNEYEDKISIPSYAIPYNNNNYWYIRFIISTIGVVILIFQKAKILYGQSSSYPTPQTRLIIVVNEIFGWLRHNKSDLLSKNTFIESFYCSLRDLLWASYMIIDKNDLIDKGLGTHYYTLPETIDFIQEGDEMESVVGYMLSGYKSDIDEEVYRKWFEEYFLLTGETGNALFKEFESFRRITNPAFKTIYGE